MAIFVILLLVSLFPDEDFQIRTVWGIIVSFIMAIVFLNISQHNNESIFIISNILLINGVVRLIAAFFAKDNSVFIITSILSFILGGLGLLYCNKASGYLLQEIETYLLS